MIVWEECFTHQVLFFNRISPYFLSSPILKVEISPSRWREKIIRFSIKYNRLRLKKKAKSNNRNKARLDSTRFKKLTLDIKRLSRRKLKHYSFPTYICCILSVNYLLQQSAILQSLLFFLSPDWAFCYCRILRLVTLSPECACFLFLTRRLLFRKDHPSTEKKKKKLHHHVWRKKNFFFFS